jgi:peptidoglycan/LPS O-acetylase OafA/YrhL
MQMNPVSTVSNTNAPEIATDLTWMDMLRGIAIIGVIFDNWTAYMEFATTPVLLHSFATTFAFVVGPFVHLFFILSGFGLTVAYYRESRASWSWKRWAWRRITKILIPYAIFVVFSFLMGIVGMHFYSSVDVRFSWGSLIAYLTFTRNFYPPSWVWNWSFWFMPLIIGLYICFPVLVKILKKWGPWALLLISAFITYGTLTVVVLYGVIHGHQADLFTFWMIQFSFGMVLAHLRETTPQELSRLLGLKAFITGVGLLIFSLALRTYGPVGQAYNDLFTSVGIFLVFLNLCWKTRAKVRTIVRPLTYFSGKSYLMYLIHYPIMQFLIGPPLRAPTNPIVVIALGGLYIILVTLLCSIITRPIDKLTSWIYRRYQA